MSKVYMYTYFTDLFNFAGLDSDERTEVLMEQERRDINVLAILKYEGLPNFPMNRNKFNDYHDLFVQMTLDDETLILLFVFCNKCVIYHRGYTHNYDSRKEAENEFLDIRGKS